MRMRVIALGALCGLMIGSAAYAAETPAEGAAVEVREGDIWSRATFLRKEGRKLQIRYDDGTEDWIMPDRMRPLTAGSATGAGTPGAAGAATAAPQGAEAVTLDGPFIEVRMDGAASPRLALGASVRLKPTTRPAPTAAPFVKLTPNVPVPIQPLSELIVCPDTPQVVVGVTERRGTQDTQILVIDLMKPETVEVRTISAGDHHILGAVSGGKLLLSTPRVGGSVTLHLWEHDGQEYRLKANYTLASEKGGKRIEWASLQTDNRAVVLCGGGETYLIDFRARRALTYFQSNHHDGGRLMCGGSVLSAQEGDSTGLVRASDLAVIGKFADAGLIRSVDPTGVYAVHTVHGRTLRVIKVASGAAVGTIAGVLPDDGRGIDLLSPDILMVKNRMLYNTKNGMPIWEYEFQNLRKSLVLPSGQVLLAFADGATSTLCIATLPDPAALAMVKAAKPSDFLLAPGANIGISGNLPSIYGGDAQAAGEILQKVVGTAGHKLVPGAARLMLDFKAAPGKTGEFVYRENPRPGVPMMGPPPMRKVPSPSTDVTVTLTCDGQPIWQQFFHFQANVMVIAQGGKTIEQAIADEGRPKAASLNGLGIPSYIAPGSTFEKAAALRKSTVTVDGFGPATAPAPVIPAKPGKVPTGAEDEV